MGGTGRLSTSSAVVTVGPTVSNNWIYRLEQLDLMTWQVYDKPHIFFDGDGAKALNDVTADIKGPGPIALVRQKPLALSQILL